jgi:hypothetical protein
LDEDLLVAVVRQPEEQGDAAFIHGLFLISDGDPIRGQGLKAHES